MSSNLETLESMCELVVDCPHSTPKWTKRGIIVLRNQNIRNGRLTLNNPSFTDEEHYQNRIKRAEPQYGDIIFTREAPMGEVCMIPRNIKCCMGQRQVLLRPKSCVNGLYLLYALQSPYVQHQINWNEGTGSTVSNVRIPVLKQIQIPRNKDEASIAHILGTLDDKIDLNRRMNQTLESMAQAIFQSWFVDFDPVKAKMAATVHGRDPERAAMAALAGKLAVPKDHAAISGEDLDAAEAALVQLSDEQRSQLAETAALFPAELVESELGLIPRGWGVGELQDLVVLQRGFDLPKKKRAPGEFPILAASGPSGTHNEFKVKGPGVVTGRSGVLGNVFYIHDDFWPLNTSLWVKNFKAATPLFAYHLLSTFDFTIFNSGSAVPSLNRNHIHSLPNLIPAFTIVEQFENIALQLFMKCRYNNLESNTISKLRDTLLPKLLSGELTVSAAEEMVG